MPQLAGGGGGGDPELCATDEMIPFKDEGDQEQIFAELSHSEEDEGDLADIKSSLVNESETSPNSNHDGTRQSQISQDSYHEKHRDHHDDGKKDGGLETLLPTSFSVQNRSVPLWSFFLSDPVHSDAEMISELILVRTCTNGREKNKNKSYMKGCCGL
uniref:CTNNB1 binding N-teminal domain-containing protein n=1 Tax=Hucho hucho TaxID=62062 RepID=A0A4W5R0J1_9TELE